MPNNELLTYALFFIPLFFIGAVLVTGLPVVVSIQSYYKQRERQAVPAPAFKANRHSPATVQGSL